MAILEREKMLRSGSNRTLPSESHLFGGGPMKSSSLWQSLIRGIVWGGLIAILHGLAFPILFLLETFLRGVLYSGQFSGLLIGLIFLASGFWMVLSFVASSYFLVPSIIGGIALALGLRYGVQRNFLLPRHGLWLGVIIGGLVALVGITWLYWLDWAWSIQENWLFAVLVTMWEMVTYAWLGQRFAPSLPGQATAITPSPK
jgi:hypothetical protein